MGKNVSNQLDEEDGFGTGRGSSGSSQRSRNQFQPLRSKVRNHSGVLRTVLQIS